MVEQIVAIVAEDVGGGSGAPDQLHGRADGKIVDDGVHQRRAYLMRQQGLDARVFGDADGGPNRRRLQARVGQPERRHAQRQEPAVPVFSLGRGVGHRAGGVPVDDEAEIGATREAGRVPVDRRGVVCHADERAAHPLCPGAH